MSDRQNANHARTLEQTNVNPLQYFIFSFYVRSSCAVDNEPWDLCLGGSSGLLSLSFLKDSLDLCLFVGGEIAGKTLIELRLPLLQFYAG